MPKFNLIGIHGSARSGKDTLGSTILARCNSYRYSFASPIYAMARAFGLTDADFSDSRKEVPIDRFGGRSPRYLLQTLGTEWGRDLVSPEIWVQLAAIKLEHAGPGMVVTDVRFENEASWIRENGILIHIHRPGAPVVNPHVSESGVEIQDGDIIISNSGTLTDLELKVDEVLQNVFSRSRN